MPLRLVIIALLAWAYYREVAIAMAYYREVAIAAAQRSSTRLPRKPPTLMRTGLSWQTLKYMYRRSVGSRGYGLLTVAIWAWRITRISHLTGAYWVYWLRM